MLIRQVTCLRRQLVRFSRLDAYRRDTAPMEHRGHGENIFIYLFLFPGRKYQGRIFPDQTCS